MEDLKKEIEEISDEARRNEIDRLLDEIFDAAERYNEENGLELPENKKKFTVENEVDILFVDWETQLKKLNIEEFNKYLAEFGMDNNNNNCKENCLIQYKKQFTSNIFKTPTIEEINNIIDNLKFTKGYDEVTTLYLKNNKEEVTPKLRELFGKCLEASYFPTKLKEDKIQPHAIINKDLTKFESWEPIFTLNTIAKVFEKIMKNQWLTSSNKQKNEAISDIFNFEEYAQHDIVKSLKTTVNKLKKSKKECLIVKLSLLKPYHSIPYKKLLEKLEGQGMVMEDLKLLQSYFTDRSQRVEILDSFSKPLDKKIGLLKGSCLDKKFYWQYMADLIEWKEINSLVLTWEDDVYLICEGFFAKEVKNTAEGDLAKVCLWLQCNSLKINEEKSAFMYFSTTNDIGKLVCKDLTLHPAKGALNYMDVLLQKDLGWSAFQEHAQKKYDEYISEMDSFTLTDAEKQLRVEALDFFYKKRVQCVIEGKPLYVHY